MNGESLLLPVVGKTVLSKKPEYQIQMMEAELYSHYEPVSDCVLQTSNESLTSEYQCLIDERAIFSWEIEFIYVSI